MRRGGFNAGSHEHHLKDGFDPYHAFVGLMPRFIDLARDAARMRAISHRNFHVGAVAYAGDTTLSRVATLDGANVKRTKEDPKYCAEMSVIDQAQGLGFSKVLGLVVAGTSDPEKIKSVSGVATPTLHPCDACRKKMTASGLFQESSLIVTVSTDEDAYEVHSYGELMRRWEEPVAETSSAGAISYDIDLWGWRQAAYGRNLEQVPDSQPWQVAHFVLGATLDLAA